MTNKVVVYLYYFTFDRPTHRSTTNNGRSETSPVQLSKQNKSCYSSWCRFASGFLNFHPAAKQNQQPTPREQKFPYFAHCCWFGANGWLLVGWSEGGREKELHLHLHGSPVQAFPRCLKCANTRTGASPVCHRTELNGGRILFCCCYPWLVILP